MSVHSHAVFLVKIRVEAVEDPAFSLKVSRDWKAGRTHGRTQWDFNVMSLGFQWILMGI